jgi:hypothetical protein
MDAPRLAKALSQKLDPKLASELVAEFVEIRQDLATKTLERAPLGKFVETFVQCLQYIAAGSYDTQPAVDQYLNQKVESDARLPDDLRICSARIARTIYTLRNKRNILHKGHVDPNTIDLAFAYSASAWIVSELLRHATGLSMQESGELITILQTPVGSLVEEINGTRIVLPKVSARVELLLLLRSNYPQLTPVADVLKSLSRRNAKSVKTVLKTLHIEKLAHGSMKDGYCLTQTGFAAAVAEIGKLTK